MKIKCMISNRQGKVLSRTYYYDELYYLLVYYLYPSKIHRKNEHQLLEELKDKI